MFSDGAILVGTPSAADFDGDGFGDVLIQNAEGQASVLLMNGQEVLYNSPWVTLTNAPDASWHIRGMGDFNSDGRTDILWQSDNGRAAISMAPALPVHMPPNFDSPTILAANPGPAWTAISTGDFNGDTYADILWQNKNGQAAIWLMSGTTLLSDAYVDGNPGPHWKVIGSWDFSGDGKSDILWQNVNGQAAIWMMDGTTPRVEARVGGNPGADWKVVGAGDFNADGVADILWQNANGQAAIWMMNGTAPVSETRVGYSRGAPWKIGTINDIDGDDKADILWQNTDGKASVWFMDGTTLTGERQVDSNRGLGWTVANNGVTASTGRAPAFVCNDFGGVIEYPNCFGTLIMA